MHSNQRSPYPKRETFEECKFSEDSRDCPVRIKKPRSTGNRAMSFVAASRAGCSINAVKIILSASVILSGEA